VWTALVITLMILGLLIVRLARTGSLPHATDFAMYWATARLNALGENPYDAERVLSLEREVDPNQTTVVLMYSPPWSLALLMPLGLLDSQVSRVLWLLVQFIAVLLSAVWLWRIYCGPVRYWWLPPILGFTFLPTLLLLRTGQLGALVLLGIVGFLHLEKRGRDTLAGAMLALTLLKPHLVYLLLLTVLLWIVRERRWHCLLGCCLTGFAATGLSLAANPLVFHQYYHAVTNHPPSDWVTPTIGTALRLLFGIDRRWLQWVPLIPGVLWLVWYWRKNRSEWVWARHAPLLLIVSLLTTCYGWSHDFVLGLLPILQVAVWVSRGSARMMASCAIALFFAIDAILIALPLVGYRNDFWAIWLSPVLIVSYLSFRRLHGPPILTGEA
jgi:hypothetical protein